ncbi:MAG TPA: DUF938 domain-containing protein [Caulobacteraceae bacterium]|nr:DUF938 domain-containing protein [Caulobacteraceae bacterium]
MTLPSSPAALRNRAPILDVLRPSLPERGRVLELAAGTGEHAVFLAGALPGLDWLPTDHDAEALAVVDARRAAEGPPNLRPAERLDATDPSTWPPGPFDAVVCINMIHIAPWSAAEGLMRLTERVLAPGGLLYLYGPYREDGVPTAPSNEAFDASLRARDPAWGLRRLEEVGALAQASGLALQERLDMPANNLSLLFRRA